MTVVMRYFWDPNQKKETSRNQNNMVCESWPTGVIWTSKPNYEKYPFTEIQNESEE